jgi:hypothetical protein
MLRIRRKRTLQKFASVHASDYRRGIRRVITNGYSMLWNA